MAVAVGLNAVTNIFLGVTLSQVWSLINGLQVIVHLPLFGSKFPVNAQVFMSKVVWIAAFELAPEEYVEYFIDYPETEPFSERFDETGYGSTLPLLNMPTDFLFFQIFLCLLGTYFLALMTKNRLYLMTKVKPWLSSRLFWTIPLRYLYEGYLEFVIVSLIGVYTLDWSED